MANSELIESEVIELLLEGKHFYGHFLQQFRRHAVKTGIGEGNIVDTLGVLINEDLQPHLYINTDFYNSGDYDPKNPAKHSWGLTPTEKIALLEHEILHILNKHLIRTENRNHYVANLAQDLAINQHIKGLPKGGGCPKCNAFVRLTQLGQFRTTCPRCGELLDPKKHTSECLDIGNFKIEGKKLNFERNKAFEIYYDALWSKMPKYMVEIGTAITDSKEKGAKSNIKGECSGGTGDGTYKQKEAQDSENKNKVGSGNNVQIQGVEIPMPMDNHETWAAGSDNREMAHEKIKEMARKALHKANAKNQGNMPGWLKSLVDQCLAHKTISWKSELKRFYGFREFSHFVPTRKRLNRRFSIAFPGYKVKRKAHIVVATDSSGSVSDEDFAKFWAEIMTMFSAGVTITHVECDMDITHVQPFKRKPPKNTKIKRYGYGGTTFKPPFELVEKGHYKNGNGEEWKLKTKVDGIIYCTDGYGDFPKKIPCPTIWVVTAEHSTHGWSPKLGKMIVMTED